MDSKNEIQVRFAGADDSAFIRDLSAKAFKPFGEYGDVVVKWHLSGDSITVVAHHDGLPAGFAMVSKPLSRYDMSGTGELLAIAVDRAWQGKGIGKLLLAGIEKVSIDAGMTTVFLHTAVENRNARKLFSDMGYGIWQIKNNFYPEGQDACVMAKSLSLK